MRPPPPDSRLHRLATRIHETTAPLTTQAAEHIRRELRQADGYPTSTLGDGMPKGATTSTVVERTAQARHHLGMVRTELDDMIVTIETFIEDLERMSRTILGVRVPTPNRCDGRPFEGATIPWVRYSHNPANGWLDPGCGDAADQTGLCPACRIRERRWRDAHNLPARTNTQDTTP